MRKVAPFPSNQTTHSRLESTIIDGPVEGLWLAFERLVSLLD